MQTTDEKSNKYKKRQLFLATHAHWIYCILGRSTRIMLEPPDDSTAPVTRL